MHPPSKRKRTLFLFRALQVVANISIIIVAVLLTIVFVKYRPWNNGAPTRLERPPRSEPLNAKGKHIQLEEVNWAANKRTMVIALQSGCKYCSESADFYKKLVELKSQRKTDVQLVAVFPHRVDLGSTYLDSLGVRITDMAQAPLASLFVSGTPTILLVDYTGLVTEVWVGRLDTWREEEVIRKIRANI